MVHGKPRGSSSIAVTWFESTRRGLAALLMLPPSPSCGPSPYGHVRRLRQLLRRVRRHGLRPPLRRAWPSFLRVALRHLPRRQPGRLPAVERAVVVSARAKLHARLAQRPHRAGAVRQTHHPRAPARNRSSRTARCGGLHLPPRDFSSMAMSFPRYKISWSGTPGLTPRCLRIAPLDADGATGSVAVQKVQAGSSHLSSRRASFFCSCHSSRRAMTGFTPPRARRRRRQFPPARGTTLFAWLQMKGTRPLPTACSPRAHVA